MASNAPVAQELRLAVAALGLERNRAAWARGASSNSYGNKGTNLNGACGPPIRVGRTG